MDPTSAKVGEAIGRTLTGGSRISRTHYFEKLERSWTLHLDVPRIVSRQDGRSNPGSTQAVLEVRK